MALSARKPAATLKRGVVELGEAQAL